MSKLDELIQKYCPDGVEYKRLGDLCSIVTKQTGFDYSKYIKPRLLQAEENGSVPYIQTKFFSGKDFNYNTDYYVPLDIVKQFPKITLDEKCLLFSIVGASIGNVGLFPGTRRCFLGGAISVAKVLPEYDADFLFYCIQSKTVQRQIAKKTKGAGQATVTVEDIRNFEVPLPPLPVQREIVRILDGFTEKTAQLKNELAAELAARREQYKAYRNKLLEFNEDNPLNKLIQQYCPDGVEYKRIENICLQVSSGGTPSSKRSEYYNGEIPWLRTQEVDYRAITKTGMTITEEGLNNSSAKWIPAHCVIVAMYGATVGKVGWNEIPLTTNQACCNLEIDAKQASFKYVYYCLANQYRYIQSLGQGSQTNINAQTVKKLEVPLPALPVQREIVSILDNFSNIVTDISSGLPAEIEARQKQYEYYRDKLLTFKRLNP